MKIFFHDLFSESWKKITVLETDTGEQVEKTQGFERTILKELGKLIP